MNSIIIILAKVVSQVSKVFKLGAGATWPGEIALRLNSNILSSFASQFSKGIIIVAGTNGKTTTSLMITHVLAKRGFRVVHNASGANLMNGVVSACIQQASWGGKLDADYGVFEVDENSLPLVVSHVTYHVSRKKLIIVLLNLFRDQLDRYGEVDVIAEKWERALREEYKQGQQQGQESKMGKKNTLQIIANADDPLTVSLSRSRPGLEARAFYFGLNDRALFQKRMDHATDSIFCPNCGARLVYDGVYYSHIGVWRCDACGLKRPSPDIDTWSSPLPGLYNQYNTLAAVATLRSVGITDSAIKGSLVGFAPAFGRQEELFVDGKRVKLFLSKNPAGFNASLQTVLAMKPKTLLLVLNDRIPDGRDVSWIWDVDFELLAEGEHTVVVSGDRCWDLAVRIKYISESGIWNLESGNFIIEPDLKKAVFCSLQMENKGETVYILATYSAMLGVRKIITGKQIL